MVDSVVGACLFSFENIIRGMFVEAPPSSVTDDTALVVSVLSDSFVCCCSVDCSAEADDVDSTPVGPPSGTLVLVTSAVGCWLEEISVGFTVVSLPLTGDSVEPLKLVYSTRKNSDKPYSLGCCNRASRFRVSWCR